ncbi:unnamed protein product [Paramecium octaurelia]|uniref:Uncharacterized protein n=1 Tax=Paramecium octaurelia TaxID=43137 RepID=A0A8S1X1Z6_PAROT|nr:unnamed protein product [Paramecium octaurelia]
MKTFKILLAKLSNVQSIVQGHCIICIILLQKSEHLIIHKGTATTDYFLGSAHFGANKATQAKSTIKQSTNHSLFIR